MFLEYYADDVDFWSVLAVGWLEDLSKISYILFGLKVCEESEVGVSACEGV